MHSLKYINGNKSKSYGPILINNDNWIGARATILNNTVTPAKVLLQLEQLFLEISHPLVKIVWFRVPKK